MSRPIPMIDDLALDHVAWARHRTAQRVLNLPVLGLEGDIQQRLGRASHEIELAGVLVGEESRDRLSDLQGKAADEGVLEFARLVDAQRAAHQNKANMLKAQISA